MMSSNTHYYLGQPNIKSIQLLTYPNIRAAWADLLRDKVDMLYEVGTDAVDLMRDAKTVSLYNFERPYQYLIILNTKLDKLRAPEIRRALNEAIDRDAIVRDALSDRGTVSAGPIPPSHWAFPGRPDTFNYRPGESAGVLRAAKLRLTCVTPAESPFERLALSVKQQLAEVGVEFDVREATPEQINKAFADRDFESVLIDPLSGWSLFRSYRWWHSSGANNLGFASKEVDDALDQIHHAVTDEDYRKGAAAYQRAVAKDPPAIFLAWGNRSRAISRRFDVQQEPGRDVLATLRMWRPSADKPNANQQ
jgi:ABC-type transport system substrate-binding protein